MPDRSWRRPMSTTITAGKTLMSRRAMARSTGWNGRAPSTRSTIAVRSSSNAFATFGTALRISCLTSSRASSARALLDCPIPAGCDDRSGSATRNRRRPAFRRDGAAAVVPIQSRRDCALSGERTDCASSIRRLHGEAGAAGAGPRGGARMASRVSGREGARWCHPC